MPVPHSPPWLRFQSPLIGRVENWRAADRVRWILRRFRSGPQSGSRRHVSSSRLVSRVENWRAAGRVRWMLRRFRSGPQSGSRGHVSSSRLVKPSVPLYGTGLWVRLFFVEDFSPYSWALLPANASLQWPFRGGHQAGQRVPASFRQPAEPRHGAEHLRSSPRQARSLLDIRAAFWYGAVGREADLRWL